MSQQGIKGCHHHCLLWHFVWYLSSKCNWIKDSRSNLHILCFCDKNNYMKNIKNIPSEISNIPREILKDWYVYDPEICEHWYSCLLHSSVIYAAPSLYCWWCIMTYGSTNIHHRQIVMDKNLCNNVYDATALNFHEVFRGWCFYIFTVGDGRVVIVFLENGAVTSAIQWEI